MPVVALSPVVVSEGLVLVSGQVPVDRNGTRVGGGFEPQFRQVLENVQHWLGTVDCRMEDVLKVNAFLATLDDFATYDRLYREYFQHPFPARTTVQAGLYGFQIEIDVIARKPRFDAQ